MRLVGHVLNHMLDCILNQILDYMIIGFVIMVLQMLFFWHEFQWINNCQTSYLQLGKKPLNLVGEQEKTSAFIDAKNLLAL